MSSSDTLQLGSQSHTIYLPPVSTWSSVVKAKKSLKKHDFNILNQDGVNSVVVPDEVFKDSSPLWEDFFIGRFLSTTPNVAIEDSCNSQ